VRELSFRREVDEDCALLGYYATSSGNWWQFLANISGQPIGPTHRFS